MNYGMRVKEIRSHLPGNIRLSIASLFLWLKKQTNKKTETIKMFFHRRTGN